MQLDADELLDYYTLQRTLYNAILWNEFGLNFDQNNNFELNLTPLMAIDRYLSGLRDFMDQPLVEAFSNQIGLILLARNLNQHKLYRIGEALLDVEC